MKKIFPQKLKPGDEIRVISPAKSLGLYPDDVLEIARTRLQQLGLKITYGKYARRKDVLQSSRTDHRVADIHDAFADKKVRAVLAAAGGHTSNQMLSHLDYELIRKNPKILCGFSDITALANAIYARTGLVTYSGPNFVDLGMLKNFEYTQEYFEKALFQNSPFSIAASQLWSDDAWRFQQHKRTLLKNEGYSSLIAGETTGTLLGGNLCTFNLLHGTPYGPSLRNAVLFVEDDDLSGTIAPQEFTRNLQSLVHLSGFSGVKGVVIGRFQRTTGMSLKTLQYIVRSMPQLAHMPVIANADFGHTTPFFTFPIGGKVHIVSQPRGKSAIEIL